MGDTPNGRDWCIKALHPSDVLTEVMGLPDESSVPSTVMNYQSTFTLRPDPTATGTWSWDAQLIPHPVAFMATATTDNVSGTNWGEFLNQQLAGTTHCDKFMNFRTMFKKWRLLYCAVTVHQDGPDLANQGTIVACQAPVTFMCKTASCVYQAHEIPSETQLAKERRVKAWVAHHPGKEVPKMIMDGPGGVWVCTNIPIGTLKNGDYPSFTTSQTLPNAYFGQSKFGCYLPLRMTKIGPWSGVEDEILFYQPDDHLTPSNHEDTLIPQRPDDPGNLIAMNQQYPYFSLDMAHMSGPPNYISGDATCKPLSDLWGNISVQNAAVTTSFTFFVRMGFECQCEPGAVQSANLHISPMFDPTAIRAYHSIVRGLKDAYPADYNDLGKIWNVIKDVASTVGPILSMIPHPVTTALGGLMTAVKPVSALFNSNGTLTPAAVNTKVSAAQLEKAREVAKAPTVVLKVPKRKKVASKRMSAKNLKLNKTDYNALIAKLAKMK